MKMYKNADMGNIVICLLAALVKAGCEVRDNSCLGSLISSDLVLMIRVKYCER